MTTLLSRRRAVLALAVTALVVAGAAACGTQDPATSQSSPAGAAAGSGAQQSTEVTTIGGEKMKVPGDKPTALFFFSVGCGACVGGAKSLAEAGRGLSGKANVLVVDMDPSESPETIRGFLDYIKAPDLPAAIDTGAVLSQRYKVAALSTLIVVDPAGQVTYRATDPGPDKIRTALETAGAR
ncbi:thiol-disulfide isomerase/thioredoxin [Kribbella aluminosa]|uniref:Thiol-disulfide isomerase/thioredoxin n=1 Tax=Kribbella aluminosa TaxID=416017 RepID=A0ABS4UBH6_9ACTN|nr:TlpA family protein disulfide reductase [Kribbella aluminosa]MBP2348953.1 thiol-disulfide isomerase/thioredoxin [Kribbella aluminosa]